MKTILHFGIHKTGTSAIQQALGRATQWLKFWGYRYPVFKDLDGSRIYNHSRVLMTLFMKDGGLNHQNQIRGYDSASKLEPLRASFTQQLRKHSYNFSTLVLSGEGLSRFDAHELRHLKNRLAEQNNATAFEGIFFVREHVSYASSAIQQYVKAGHSLEESAARMNRLLPALYQRRCSPAIEVFGAGQLRFYLFEEAKKYRAGLVRFFLDKVMPKVLWWPFGDHRSNESLCHEAIALISEVNKAFPRIKSGEKNPLREIGDLYPLYALEGRKFLAELPSETLERVHEDREWLATSCGITLPDIPEAADPKRLWRSETFASLSKILPQLSERFAEVIVRYVDTDIRKLYLDDPRRQEAIDAWLRANEVAIV